jgi:hypothetical protein
VHQLVVRRVLEQEATGEGVQGAMDGLVQIERREDEDPDLRAVPDQASRGLDPSIPGIRTSMSTRSGRVTLAAATAE